MQTAETPRPKRVTKRRAETRQRLLDAAGDVFAEEGFGRSTVEQVCERAGFTRGAFYSNFTSLDELFLAMWEQRSATMLDGIRTALADRPATLTLDSAVERVLAAIPVDDAWYRITAEFTAHALRNPALKRVMAAREDAILGTILPIVEDALAAAGRRVTDRAALGRALVAIHDGTAVQVLMEPENEAVRQARQRLFVTVVSSYSSGT
ncbi:TetR family transcriptional regulator [Rhodococcus hoagii]|uniref:Transcriptional regulator, TetR family n=3 Tax=Rhodococcus hoagii TaxID=43767 RepID=E9T808_RHOHA|nr:TetR family transcriptional regulator [Prescottella equi]MBU4615783.1 TetR family transcriptional regulator [Rhodococcus sp. GG48]MCD7052852.1 TetR family transcriptional regulator [Rhodococcus sp. BH2-1]GBF16512.1 HTH-type transcriptional regulator AcrR [Rhodococcus sp. Br-6]EGD21412.1 transcriptional regulator, TetR family [Prescottella equi ATCC 33707]ERN48005.1 tetr family transcriptional regulator [Prescottella equi NBRC 101255 = C 7]